MIAPPMATLELSRTVAAPPEVVFEVLTDHRGYAEITAMRSVELEREGDPAPNGVGAIRSLRLIGPPVREEVIAYDPPRRFAYRLLSGVPVRDHVGTVELEPVQEGTRMTYVVETKPKVPLAGFAITAVIRRSVADLVSGIAEEAERRAR